MQYYKILRFYSDGRQARKMDSGLTLRQAQAHCTDPETSSTTATKGRSSCRCNWFDGYTAQ